MEYIQHWCANCPWGRIIGDMIFCPLAKGSCVRIKSTMNELDERLETEEDFRDEYNRQKMQNATFGERKL